MNLIDYHTKNTITFLALAKNAMDYKNGHFVIILMQQISNNLKYCSFKIQMIFRTKLVELI